MRYPRSTTSSAALMKCGATLGVAALLCSCGGGGGYSSGGGGGYGGSNGTSGSMQVWMTDAPSCGYDHVYVTVQKVSVNQSSTASDTDAGWVDITPASSQRLDLLALNNGVLANLGLATLQAGTYTQLRLVLATNSGTGQMANSVVPTGGNEVGLSTPSAQQSGLKMNVNLTVAANQMADVVIDFNACQSIVHAGNSGNYILKPVLTVTPQFLSGVTGYVNMQLNPALTSVSLQQSGAIVKAAMPDVTGKFVLEPAAPGTYDLVITSPLYANTVVTGVAVAANTITSVSASSSPITPQGSLDGTLTGFVMTGVSPVDASIMAKQALTMGETIVVAASPVDADTGAYSLSVATGAPEVATFMAPPAALSFAADMAASGTYSLVASSGAASKTATGVHAVAGASVTTNFTFP